MLKKKLIFNFINFSNYKNFLKIKQLFLLFNSNKKKNYKMENPENNVKKFIKF